MQEEEEERDLLLRRMQSTSSERASPRQLLTDADTSSSGVLSISSSFSYFGQHFDCSRQQQHLLSSSPRLLIQLHKTLAVVVLVVVQYIKRVGGRCYSLLLLRLLIAAYSNS